MAYIDRDALIFDLKTSFVPQSTTYTDAVGIAIRWLKDAPAADVAPVVHGRWVKIVGQPHVIQCDVCGSTSIEGVFNYCPNCGAHMKDGDSNGQD